MAHAGAHGYIRLTLANQNGGQAAIQAVRNWANTPGNLNPSESVDNVGWMEDPAGPPTNNGKRPLGDQVIVEVSVPGTKPADDVAHQRVQALIGFFENLKAGAVSHFQAGLSHHWCCYSDI